MSVICLCVQIAWDIVHIERLCTLYDLLLCASLNSISLQILVIKHINRVHAKCQKFQCEQCLKQFANKYNLETHNNTIHEKRIKFQCNRCLKQFGQKGNLERHIKTVHEKLKEFPCEQCPIQFGRKNDLEGHIKRVHGKRKEFLEPELGGID